MSKYDAVNPGHYGKGKFQLWDFFGRQFAIQNAIKYIIRYEQKNGLEDLKKAKNYLEKAQFTERQCSLKDFLEANPDLSRLQQEALLIYSYSSDSNQQVAGLKNIVNQLLEKQKRILEEQAIIEGGKSENYLDSKIRQKILDKYFSHHGFIRNFDRQNPLVLQEIFIPIKQISQLVIDYKTNATTVFSQIFGYIFSRRFFDIKDNNVNKISILTNLNKVFIIEFDSKNELKTFMQILSEKN